MLKAYFGLLLMIVNLAIGIRPQNTFILLKIDKDTRMNNVLWEVGDIVKLEVTLKNKE